MTLSLTCVGISDGVRRAVSVDLALQPGHPNSVFKYGVASRGPIIIGGFAEILGKNDMTEASVISATASGVAVSVGGDAVVEGDISTVGTPTSVVISGRPTIAGSDDPAVIADHIHFGVAPPVIPEERIRWTHRIC